MTTRPGVNVTASEHHVSTLRRAKAARIEYDFLSPKTCLRPVWPTTNPLPLSKTLEHLNPPHL